jgi:hypothetical protein
LEEAGILRILWDEELQIQSVATTPPTPSLIHSLLILCSTAHRLPRLSLLSLYYFPPSVHFPSLPFPSLHFPSLPFLSIITYPCPCLARCESWSAGLLCSSVTQNQKRERRRNYYYLLYHRTRRVSHLPCLHPPVAPPPLAVTVPNTPYCSERTPT